LATIHQATVSTRNAAASADLQAGFARQFTQDLVDYADRLV
jgi:hypothetical protein